MKRDWILTLLAIAIAAALGLGVFLPDPPLVDVDGQPIQERDL